jgi:hypothetical protein
MRICVCEITAIWLQNYGFSICISILNSFENSVARNYGFSKCILIECQTIWLSKPKDIDRGIVPMQEHFTITLEMRRKECTYILL